MMKSRSHGLAVCYNIQAAVDEKNKMVVAVDVTNEATDYKQLEWQGFLAQKIFVHN